MIFSLKILHAIAITEKMHILLDSQIYDKILIGLTSCSVSREFLVAISK